MKRPLNNAAANRLIKSLLCDHKVVINNHDIIKQGFEVYNAIKTTKSPLIVANLLKLCVKCKHPEKVLLIWDDVNYILQQNKHKPVLSYPLLINVYAKCSFVHSLMIFDSISHENKNIVTFCAMMSAYSSNLLFQEALQLYDSINIQKDDICHVIALKACINLHNWSKGKQISKQIQSHNSYKEISIQLKTTLINFYGCCGDIPSAFNIFNTVPNNTRDVVIYNAMLTALIDNNFDNDALELYDKLSVQQKNDISHSLALKACDKTNNYDKGINVFTSIQHNMKSIVCVNAMLSCLVNNNENRKALELYENVKTDIKKDDICHILALKACSNSYEYIIGKNIIDKYELETENNINVKNTLIHFYGDSLNINNALNIFNCIAVDKVDIVTIGAMMDAYSKNNMNSECIELFKNINSTYQHIKPDIVCYVILFANCTTGNAFYFGKKIHDKLKDGRKNKFILRNTEIQTSLINMYGCNGYIDVCLQIFDEIKRTQYNKYCNEITIWNAMLNVFGKNGDIHGMKKLYDMMLQNGFNLIPDRKTYIALLSAYGHCDNVKDAKYIWQYDIKCNNMKYDAFVVSSLVDGLSRKGELKEAKCLIEEYEKYHQHISDCYNESMWVSLLNGCRIHKNVSFAKEVYKQYNTIFSANEAVSILMWNIMSTS